MHALVGTIRDSKIGRPHGVVATGGLEVAPVRLAMPPGFPVAYKAEAGKSRVPVADFAGALVDEIEHPAPIHPCFTVGY